MGQPPMTVRNPARSMPREIPALGISIPALLSHPQGIRDTGEQHDWSYQTLAWVSLCADLANCKLMTFPVGIYKAMRSVTEGIHRISLANNELKSITSRFVTTFSQLTGKELPLPILWDIPGAPRLLQRGQSTQECPLSSHLLASISSDPPKIHFSYPFCPLKDEDRSFAHTHPSKLVSGCCRVTVTLQLPPRMGLRMEEDRKGSLGITTGHGRDGAIQAVLTN